MLTRNLRLAPAAATGAALLAFLLAGPAPAALVIDNFEQGGFTFQATTALPAGGAQLQFAGVNCIADLRQVSLTSNGPDPSHAQLVLQNPDDEVQMVMPENGGRLILEYEPAPADLTGGGPLGRIDVLFSVAEPGARIEILLEDSSGQNAVESQQLTGGGTYQFFLTDFDLVDPTHVVRILAILNALGVQGDFHLRDIRVRGEDDSPTEYDVTLEESSGPPYPIPPVRMAAEATTMPPMPLGIRQLSLHAAREEGVGPIDIPTRLMARDSGGPPRMSGLAGEVMIFWVPPDPQAPFPPSSFFDVFWEPGHAPDPQVPPNPIVPAPGTFLVGYGLEVENAEAALADKVTEQLRFDIGPGQPLAFENVLVDPPDPMMSSFHITFALQKTAGGTVDPDMPLFTMAVTGDFIPVSGTSAIEIETAPGAGGGRFWAQPSVMTPGTQTELRFDGLPAEPAFLVLYNVAGRAVRALRILPGASATTWDGRDEAGREAPAGMYVARLTDGGRSLATRVVKLR